MKKILCMVMAATMVLTFTACGSKKASIDASATNIPITISPRPASGSNIITDGMVASEVTVDDVKHLFAPYVASDYATSTSEDGVVTIETAQLKEGGAIAISTLEGRYDGTEFFYTSTLDADGLTEWTKEMVKAYIGRALEDNEVGILNTCIQSAIDKEASGVSPKPVVSAYLSECNLYFNMNGDVYELTIV